MSPQETERDSPRLPVYAVIIAGGYGTRFWPVSRRDRPKQFLALTGAHSLLRQTIRRLPRSIPPSRIYVVGNAAHRKLLRRELPELSPSHFLLEPEARNTAAAIALAAEHIRRDAARSGGDGADAVMAVFPADHAVADGTAFRRVVGAALEVAAGEDAMVVLGVPPTRPDTGFGYVERGFAINRLRTQPVFAVRRFTEKPDPRTAARYLRTKRYFWNAGIFFWRLSFFDAVLKQNLPRTRSAMRRLGARIGRPGYKNLLQRLYPKLENISVDYALAEPIAAGGQARVLVADVGWSDMGSWSAVYDWFTAAGQGGDRGNLIPGESFTLDASGNLIQAGDKFIAVIGVNDLVVVETPDALLICPREQAQQVGEVVRHLLEQQKRKLL